MVAWLQSVDDASLFLSAVTLGEIQAGIERTREQDPAKAAEIEAWLERVASAWKVLAMDAAAFREWARLMRRQSDTLYDDAGPDGGHAQCRGLPGARGGCPQSFRVAKDSAAIEAVPGSGMRVRTP